MGNVLKHRWVFKNISGEDIRFLHSPLDVFASLGGRVGFLLLTVACCVFWRLQVRIRFFSWSPKTQEFFSIWGTRVQSVPNHASGMMVRIGAHPFIVNCLVGSSFCCRFDFPSRDNA